MQFGRFDFIRKKFFVEYAFDSLFFCKIFPIGLHPHFDWLINSFFYCKHGKKRLFFQWHGSMFEVYETMSGFGGQTFTKELKYI